MNPFRLRHQLCSAILAAVLVTGPVSARGELVLTASTPTVVIETRAAGRNFLRLPSLQYDFLIDARCSAGMMPQSLLLSVADTTRSLTAAEIAAGTRIELSMLIPAGQIAPVSVDRFCLAPEAGDDASEATGAMPARSLSIPALISAQGSLLCADGDTQKMTYASRPLDVELVCAARAADDALPAE